MGYLVITRKVGERLTIGDDIEILISDIGRVDETKKVDIAIKAPKEKYKISRLGTLMEEQREKDAKVRVSNNNRRQS